MTDTWNT